MNLDISLENIRQIVEKKVDRKRFDHILAVEREIVRLGKIYMPERLCELSAAALLHDLTKNYTVDQHLTVFERYGVTPTDSLIHAPKLLHAQTAALIIKNELTCYDLPDIISAIENHTSGKRGMSVFDRLLFLADYIEETRTFEDCVLLRDFFWKGVEELIKDNELIDHLNATMAYGLDLTIKNLIDEGKFIAHETVDARNWFVSLL